MEVFGKAALGALGGALGGDNNKMPSTIKLEGGAAKAAAIMEQAKHQLNVERITSSRQLQVLRTFEALESILFMHFIEC